MSATELIKEITRLPIERRIFIVERTLKSIRDTETRETSSGQASSAQVMEENDSLQKAVNMLLHDYSSDKDLTAFTGIDFDKFYEAR